MYENLYDTLESIAWLWRLLGIHPFIIKHSSGSQTYRISTFLIIFQCIIVAATIQYSYEFYYFLEKMRQRMQGLTLSLITAHIQHISSMICIIDAIILKFIFAKKIISTIEKLSVQDKYLNEINCRINYLLVARRGRWLIFIFLFLIYLQIQSEIFTDFRRGFSIIIRSFGDYLLLLQVVDIMLFSWLVANVGIRFKELNRGLEVSVVNMQIQNCMFPAYQKFFHTSTKVHADLCNICKELNRIFVLSIMNCVLTNYILTTTVFYYIFVELKNAFIVNHVLYHVSRILRYVGMLVILTLSCNWTSTQAAETIKVLHKIPLKYVEVDDKYINQMVRVFSMQIIHHNLQFTAWGLYSVDTTLLKSLAQVITTYLVILIQFDPHII